MRALHHLLTKTLKNTLISIDFGAEDALIPDAQIDAVKAKLTPLDHTLRVHAKAGHGFTHRNTSKEVAVAADEAQRFVCQMIDAVL